MSSAVESQQLGCVTGMCLLCAVAGKHDVRSANSGADQYVEAITGVRKIQFHLDRPAILRVGGCAGFSMICYEQLLTWPILTWLIREPTVIVAIANDYWAAVPTVPEFERSAAAAWAQLMSIAISRRPTSNENQLSLFSETTKLRQKS